MLNDYKIEPTPDLQDDRDFQLAYEIAYKRLRRLAENAGLTEEVRKLDENFQEAAKHLKML